MGRRFASHSRGRSPAGLTRHQRLGDLGKYIAEILATAPAEWNRAFGGSVSAIRPASTFGQGDDEHRHQDQESQDQHGISENEAGERHAFAAVGLPVGFDLPQRQMPEDDGQETPHAQEDVGSQNAQDQTGRGQRRRGPLSGGPPRENFVATDDDRLGFGVERGRGTLGA